MNRRVAIAVWGVLGCVVLITALGVAWRFMKPPQAPTPDDRSVMTVHVGPKTTVAKAKPGSPNVVLVLGCTVRKDQTSLYGGTATPFLARLGHEGVVFDDVIAAAPWTRAAATALLTGHHSVSIGMAEPLAKPDDRVLPAKVVTLAEHFRDHGYTTLGLTTNPNLNALYGFDQGFDRYQELARLWRVDGTKLPGDAAVAMAVALLDDAPKQRFYLQLVLVDAHSPIVAGPRELEAMADPTVPEHVVRYRVGLRRLDAAISGLADALTERGFDASNTLFVFVSDHGEGLSWPTHHGPSHGRFLSPSVVNAAWVLRGPGLPAGRRVPGVASGQDVAPTVAALAGLAPFPAGTDLSAAALGIADRVARGPVYSDTWFRQVDRAARFTDTQACQMDFQLADGPFPTTCFDRADDPMHDTPHPDDAGLAALRAWRTAELVAGRDFGPVIRARSDPDTTEALRALGYVD